MPRARTAVQGSSVSTARQRPRRLIAGLRVSEEDEQLLALVAPLFPEADSAGDLAYRLWRRGLELTLAEVACLGAALPPGMAEEQFAALAAQRLLLCLPLLRRTGKLSLLGLEAPVLPTRSPPLAEVIGIPEIDASAAATVAGLGGGDFL